MAISGFAGVSAIDATLLSSDVDGVVVMPGDARYAAECATYNLALPRPAPVAVTHVTASRPISGSAGAVLTFR
jgi:hypothetical protein